MQVAKTFVQLGVYPMSTAALSVQFVNFDIHNNVIESSSLSIPIDCFLTPLLLKTKFEAAWNVLYDPTLLHTFVYFSGQSLL